MSKLAAGWTVADNRDMADAPACGCNDDEPLLCEVCRMGAVELAGAIAEMVAHTRANGVNVIEYTDPFTGRVSTLRRDDSGAWLVVDVRRLGSAERSRTRPSSGHA
jgi:hypothetical protein